MLHFALYSLVPIFAGAGIHLIERRGRHDKIDPHRQIELGTLLESMPEAVFLFDSSEKVLDVNAAAQQLCASDRGTTLSSNASELTKRFGADSNEIDFPENAVRHALQGHTIR